MKYIYLLLISATILFSCGSEEKNQQSPHRTEEQTSTESDQNQEVQKLTYPEYFVTDEDGKEIAHITHSKKKVEIHFGDDLFSAKKDSYEKRKYKNKNGDAIATVKYSDKGFKIKKEDLLIYKLKRYPNKLKIGTTDDMKNPYEIKQKEENLVVCLKNEQKLGDAISDKQIVTVHTTNQKFIVKGTTLQSASVLLLPEEMIYRLILLAEIQ